MTRLFFSTMICLLFGFSLNSQLVVNFTDALDAAEGSQVTIDVSVEDFDELVLIQFGILWDAEVASFNSITNITDELPQFSEDGNIGTPENAGMEINDGELFISWSLASAEPFSLPDGTILFSVVLDIVGDECDETTIAGGDLPPDRLIEVYDETFNMNLGIVSNDGMISIDGNCDGMDDGVGLIAECVSALPGDMFCVEVTVENFVDIETAQSGITWDTTVIEFTGVQNFGLPGLSGSLFNQDDVGIGELKFLWFDNTGSNPATLDDGSVIFEICFEVVGELGDQSPISFVDLPDPPPLFIEFSSMGQTLPFFTVDGKVLVEEPPVDMLEITGGEVFGCSGKVCVPFTTNNFDNIGSIQYTMVFDTLFMSYCGQDSLNTELPITDFNFNGINESPEAQISKVRFSWNASTNGTLADGSVLYEICFELTGAEGMGMVDIVNDPPINIEFGDLDGNAIPNNQVQLTSGKITKECTLFIKVIDIDAACFGGNGGAEIQACNGVEPYSYTWKDSNGGTVGNQDEIFNQPAGDYEICVIDADLNEACMDINIPESPEIFITLSTTNAGCGSNGSVSFEFSGGTGEITPTLNPNGDINNLPPNTYTLTATDAAGCSRDTMFTIEDMVDPLSVDVMFMNPCSAEENGIVDISFDGGCEPICMVAGQNCDEVSSLPPGDYTVTVSEGGDMITESFSIVAENIMISSAGIGPSSGNDGFVNITVTSGCNQFSWVGPNGFSAQTQNIANLAQGQYTVTVTCDNDCTASASFVVPNDSECAAFVSLIVEDASCFGLSGIECDGSIVGTLPLACSPSTISVNGGPAMPNLNLNGLCAGDYEIEVFQDGDLAFTEMVTVGEPDQLTVTIDTTGASEGACDGSIELNIFGGTSPFDVEWNQLGVEGTNPEGLCAGFYTAIITDANGCDLIAQSIQITDGEVIGTCFEGANIITPNGDGANDAFFINCATSVSNTIQVFDRWGRMVYGSTNYKNDWTGLHNDGDELAEGAYMWVLEVELGLGEIRVYQGTITILRG